MTTTEHECVCPEEEQHVRVLSSVQLPSDIGGEGWTMSVEKGERVQVDCVDDNAYWSVRLITTSGEQRFVVDARAWEVDVTEVLPKIAQVVTEQIGRAAGDTPAVKLMLEVTYT